MLESITTASISIATQNIYNDMHIKVISPTAIKDISSNMTIIYHVKQNFGSRNLWLIWRGTTDPLTV